jgi:hypothetical protein
VTFAPTESISAKLAQPVPWQRSIRNDDSLVELSFHVRLL